MLTQKPYFILEVTVRNCLYELIFNGVYQHVDVEGTGLQTEFPVNHWVSPGRNEILLHVYRSDTTESSFCRVALKVRQHDSAPALARTMSVLSYSGHLAAVGREGEGSTEAGRFDSAQDFERSEQGDLLVEQWQRQAFKRGKWSGVTLRQVLHFTSALPMWAFTGGAKLPDFATLPMTELAALHADLYQQYAVIQQALQKRQPHTIMPLFVERNRELELAYYEHPGSRERELRMALQDAMDDPDQSLLELQPDYVGLEVCPGRRLVRMMRANGGPAIVFNYPGRNLSRSFELLFRRHHGRWILSR